MHISNFPIQPSLMFLGSARLHNLCNRLPFPFSHHFPPKHNSISTSQKDQPQPTTMAAKDNPTMEIPLRAAKGVSRFFLFEALRTGCDEIETTSSQLRSARDKAEKILARESTVELGFEYVIQDVCLLVFALCNPEFDLLMKKMQVLSSCAKSLQTHAAIVEAVAETMRGDVDESDEKDGKTLNKFALLVAHIKDAAAGVEQLRDVNVSRPYFLVSPLLVCFSRTKRSEQSHRSQTFVFPSQDLTHLYRSTRRTLLYYQQKATLTQSRKCYHPRSQKLESPRKTLFPRRRPRPSMPQTHQLRLKKLRFLTSQMRSP
jgi:hypothetical protein